MIIPTLVVQGVGGGLLLTPLFNIILSRLRPTEVGVPLTNVSPAPSPGDDNYEE
jgi:hypothetical protein